MQRPSGQGPASQAPERAIREDGKTVRVDGPHRQPSASRGSRLVMIVDDHAQFRSSLRYWIEGLHAGYELVEAQSGEDAVALMANREVDIVLMDISLPGIDGIEAARRIRALRPGTQVIMVTYHDELPLRQAAESAGACGYVLKSSVCRDLEPLLALAIDQTRYATE